MAVGNVLVMISLFSGLMKREDCEKGFDYKMREGLQTDEIQVLYKLLKKYFETESTNLAEGLYKKLQIPCSAFFLHRGYRPSNKKLYLRV